MKIKIMSLLCLLSGIGFAQEDEVKLVAGGFSFPEGPAWDGSSILYISNCYSDWVGAVANGKVDTLAKRPTEPYNFGKTNGMTVGNDGFIYACDYENGAIVKFDKEGKCYLISDGYQGEKYSRPNDLAFDAKGRIYFSDPTNVDHETPQGRLFRLDENGEPELLLDEIAYPNGLAFTEDGNTLYLSESAKSRVLKITLDEEGRVADKEVFYDLKFNDPDGLALDVEGNVYVAHFGGGIIHVVSPEGEKIREIKLPGKKCSNVEFGGPDMKTLYITEVETNSLYKYENDIAGLKLRQF